VRPERPVEGGVGWKNRSPNPEPPWRGDPKKARIPFNKLFGQTSFSGSDCSRFCVATVGLTDAGTLCKLLGVALDSHGRMYVGDSVENRILGFRQPLISTIPDTVLGQGNQFLSDRPNLDGSAPSAETLSYPTAVAVDGSDNLFTTDTDNNRVLQYLQPYAEPGVLSQSATAMPFGSVAVGSRSSAIDVMMTNIGVVPIFIYRITIAGRKPPTSPRPTIAWLL